MNKDELIWKINMLRRRIGHWEVYIGKETLSDFSIGCFYDENSRKWKVFVNEEKGRHRIRLETTNEAEAYNKLISILKFTAENESYYKKYISDSVRHGCRASKDNLSR